MATQGRYRPDWTIGTLTLVEGAKEFTTIGSALEVGDIQPGDSIITASGLTLIIESITGQNSGTLMHPCSMIAAGANQPLRIRYQPEGSRLAGMAASLFQRLGSGALYSLGELVGEEGQFLRFLAPGVLEAVASNNLNELAELEKIETLIALAGLVLGGNKLLITDANKKLSQSDITAAALVFLKLAGAAAANKLPYFDSENSAALAELTAAGRALLNLAGTPIANQLPYLNGDSSAALAPLTPVARTLLDDTTVAAMRGTIGAGKPAFKAHLSTNQLIYNGTTNLTYTGTILNVGNCWNGFQFTAPEAGVYFFSMGNTLIDGNNGLFLSQIFVNGSVNTEIVWGWGSSGVQYYRAGVCSVLVNLAAGATVQFKLALEGVSGSPQMQAFRNHAVGFMI